MQQFGKGFFIIAVDKYRILTVNFFFGIKSSILDSKLTIPRFQNSGLVKKEYTALKLEIKNHSWKIHRLVDDVWKKVDYSDKYYKSIAAHDSLMALKVQN